MAQATTCGTDVLPFIMPLMTTAAEAAKTKKTGMAVLLMMPGRRILPTHDIGGGRQQRMNANGRGGGQLVIKSGRSLGQTGSPCLLVLQAHDLEMAPLVPSSSTTWNAHLLNNLTVSAMAPAEAVLFQKFACGAIRMEDGKNSSEALSPHARSSFAWLEQHPDS